MSEIFSRYFKQDWNKKSAQYTACVAVLLFRAICRDVFGEKIPIEEEDSDIKQCHWNSDFYVPRRYPNAKKLNDNSRHCMILSYIHTGYTGGKFTNNVMKECIEKMCEVAVCIGGISDPNEPQRKMEACVSIYKNKLPPYIYRNSTRRADSA